MSMKIVCDSCGTEFKFEVAKDFKQCPVCGASFDDDKEHGEKDSEEEGGVMYFDLMDIFEDEPEYNCVDVYCQECGKSNSLKLDKFDKLVNKEYVILKQDVTLKCQGCGKEHKPRKILYKKKDHYVSILRHCPVCNSTMLKKITKGSKLIAAATLGTFALPYNSKTFECRDCGYRF